MGKVACEARRMRCSPSQRALPSRVFVKDEDTRILRLKSKLFELRTGYANRSCATHNTHSRSESSSLGQPRIKKKAKHKSFAKRLKKTKAPECYLWGCLHPGIRQRRRYPHSPPEKQAFRTPNGVCEPELRYAQHPLAKRE